jgi:hypothetical protein
VPGSRGIGARLDRRDGSLETFFLGGGEPPGGACLVARLPPGDGATASAPRTRPAGRPVRGLGVAGPGPSCLDPRSGGPENDFTNRNTTFMTWTLTQLARMIKSQGGIPAHGNRRSKWDAGCRFEHPNPEHR